MTCNDSYLTNNENSINEYNYTGLETAIHEF